MTVYKLPIKTTSNEDFYMEGNVLCVEKDYDRLVVASEDEVIEFVNGFEFCLLKEEIE